MPLSKLPKVRYPASAGSFMALIDPERELWRCAIEPAQRDDDASPARVMFWLATDEDRCAVVSHEYDRMMVTLDRWYWFDLKRLHENANWTWRQHLLEKNWCRDAHLELIDALNRLIPSPLRATKALR